MPQEAKSTAQATSAATTPAPLPGTIEHELLSLTSALDSASSLSPLERLRLGGELAAVRKSLATASGAMEKLRLSGRLAAVRKALGAGAAPAVVQPEPVTTISEDEAVAEGFAERKDTSHLYGYDPERTQGDRKKQNAAAIALLKQIESGEVDGDKLSDEQKATLARYSGKGGNLKGAGETQGSAYEYFTPKPIAEGVWGLLTDLGFAGGRVLDPCAGVGVFGGTAPVNAAVDAVELDGTSGKINGLVNNGPGYKATVAPFERVAAGTPDESYDAVVANVPFSKDVDIRGGNQLLDPKYQREPIDHYFMLRSMEKLRPNGLAAFIVPPRIVSDKGGKSKRLRERLSLMGEFMGAYRLPNKVFGTAAADTITDVVVFRKFSAEAAEKIAELREQAPAKLGEANVLWAEFIEGHYFTESGRRYVLGEFQAKDPNKIRDVDRVLSDQSVANIGKLLRKFEGSRIDWAVLDAAETTPIVYRDGDTITHAGQTLQMQDGRWVVLSRPGAEEAEAAIAASLAKCTSPLVGVENDITFVEASKLNDSLVESGRVLDVPTWLRELVMTVGKLEPELRAATWNAAMVGLAIDQVMTDEGEESIGTNYLATYPKLSDAMARVVSDAASPPSMLPVMMKAAMRKVPIFYSRKTGYSAVWRGDVADLGASSDNRSDMERFEAARYAAGGGIYVSIDAMRELFGADFDPMGSDEWCLSADGKSVAKADDYYVGNFADFLIRINAEIGGASDPAVRAKLARQKAAAEARLQRLDPEAMSFNVFSPFVSLEEKCEFLRRFYAPGFYIKFTEDGEREIAYEKPKGSKDDEDERNLARLPEYVNKRIIATRSGEQGKADPKLEAARIAKLRATINGMEAQFGAWVKSNPIIMERLRERANDPSRVYFQAVEDESPLKVAGLNPEWKLRGFQNAYVRRASREFSGINGFGVGLGKTSTALVTVQYAQSIRSKRKTMFVVPNSVLSNWRREAGRVLADTSDCLYVGLRTDKKGKLKADTAFYDQDLTSILENRHAKIFLTYEAFARLRLRATTAEAYDAHLALHDASYAASEKDAENEKTKSKRGKLIQALMATKGKSLSAPHFEDLGVDSIVFDEGHMLKNSRDTIDFKGGKFLSLAESSSRGVDAQAKAWWVRKQNARSDGVILLTATPITNSPAEIYSMLSLAVGDERVNHMMLGTKGADDFMRVTCRMESRDEETIDGTEKPYQVFTALENVETLRKALHDTCSIKTAEQVGDQIVAPEADEQINHVELSESTNAILKVYKEAFRFAIDTLSGKKEVGGSEDSYNAVAEKFGEPMELIGHPFNLIKKMAALIADPELDQLATFYTFSPAQADAVAAVVQKWNAKPPTDERARPGPFTKESAVVGTKRVKDGEDEVVMLKVQCLASIDGSRIVLDTMDHETQSDFEAAAEKAGIELDVTIPPKLAAMLANFQNEEANPRGKIEGAGTSRVRQLIFCDDLALHNKIKRLLVKRCGVSPASIAIITGRVNNKPDEIMAVQEGFNADGDYNLYRVVIANEKAEVGINLQKGTQAIHHLTLGWTPDSLTQRNGRGVRQGNETERVNVYHYDAGGTFDSYKRVLVGKKADWINAVMDGSGSDTVEVTGGMSKAEQEALIDAVGDAGAMGRIQARADAEEKLRRATSTRAKQAVSLLTMKSQREWLARFPDALAFAAIKVAALVDVSMRIGNIKGRLENPKASSAALVKNQNLLAEAEAAYAGMLSRLSDALIVKTKDYNGEYPSTLADLVKKARTGAGMWGDIKKMSPADRAAAMVKGADGWLVTVVDQSALVDEWKAEKDMAESLIQQSRAEFSRQSGQTGGHSSLVLQYAEDGRASVVDGHVVCESAFVRSKSGSLGVVVSVGKVLNVRYIENARVRHVALADEIRGGEVFQPGTPEYDQCCTEAAKAEDDMLRDMPPMKGDQRDLLISAVVPQVAQRRLVKTPVRYEGGLYGFHLPEPYFPFVFDVAEVDGSPLLAAIVADQNKVIDERKGSSFVCDSSVDVKRKRAETDGVRTILLSWAAALGKPARKGDFAAVGGYFNAMQLLAFAMHPEVEITTLIRDACVTLPETETEFADNLLTALRAATPATLDFDSMLASADGDVVNLIRMHASAGQIVNNALSRIRTAAREREFIRQREEAAKAAAENPSAVAPVVVAPLAQDDGALDELGDYIPANDNEVIGITGDTKAWFPRIKQTAIAEGAHFKWVGAEKSSTPHWRVPYSVLVKMRALYPACRPVLKSIRVA